MFWTRFTLRWTLYVLILLLGAALLAGDTGHNLPVGSQITYITNRDGSSWDIHLMDVERRLSFDLSGWFLNGHVRNRYPVWTSDGRELIFVTEFRRYRGMDIMMMNPSIPLLRFVTDSPHDETAPAVTPTGTKRIAYEFFNGHDWDIHVQRVGYEDIQLAQQGSLISGSADDRMPRWSPDGSQLAFISNRASLRNDIYVVNADGRSLRRLTRSMDVQETIEWSPTGTHIAFVTPRDSNREIYIVNVETRAVTNLTRNPGGDYAPAWSPDGSQIAFVSIRDGDDDIYIMDASGNNVQKLTHNLVVDTSPVWSPDGSQILYTSESFFSAELFLYDLDTGIHHRLTYNLYDEWSPTWRPK